MQSKSLLIAVAAFAVTATGVYAHDGGLLLKAGLSEDQVQAVEEARELRQDGDFTGARDLLADSGIDEGVLRSIKDAAKEARSEVQKAVQDEDYEAFKVAAEDSPISDIITSQADFEQLVEAHELRMSGENEEARKLMEGLGVDVSHNLSHRKGSGPQDLNQFTEEQREALFAARQANDREAIQAIFDEAGVEHGKGKSRGNR